MMRRRGQLLDLLFLAGTCATAAGLLWYGASIPVWQDDTLGPGAYPLLALTGVLLCGGWLLVRAAANRDLRLISPFPEGLADDTRLRMLVGPLARSMGRPIQVDRRVGEGPFSAFHAGLRLSRDGGVATILASDATGLPNFDAAAFCDGRFQPAAGLFFDPDVAVVRADAGWRTLAEALAARPDGSLRVGFNHHPDLRHGLDRWMEHGLGARFAAFFQADPKVLVDAVASGEIDVAMLHFSEARVPLADGRVRCVAVAAPEAPADLGPALRHADGAPFASGRWAAVMLPVDVPEAERARWEAAVLSAVHAIDEGGAPRDGSAWMALPGAEMAALLRIQAASRGILPDRGQPELGRGRRPALIVAVLGLAAFPFVMPQLGFSITAFLYAAGLTAMLWPRLTARRLAASLAAAAVLSFGSEALFGGVFGVVFPAARLFGG
ncbi:tripartite tricarboxylate transporter TctB family protein [Stella sp.]|uniref:tripartite tricarboxylate transporter TctB family protein n=1 Tax=Stella sp. TaxID=2912054 RepID=UPI0035ADBB6A